MFKSMFIVKNDKLFFQLSLLKSQGNINLWNFYSTHLKSSASWNDIFTSDLIYDSIIGPDRLFFRYIQKFDMLIVIIVDNFNTPDKIRSIFKEIINILEDNSNNFLNSDNSYDIFTEMFFALQENIPIKVSLVGFGGVGKTTIIKLLKQQKIPDQHIPTILTDISHYNLNGIFFNFWDFAGQIAYKKVWTKFINKSDLVIVVTDSSQQNVSLSKFFLDLISNVTPNSKKLILANKQDTPNALDIPRINKILGENTIPFVAIDPNYRPTLLLHIFSSLNLTSEGNQVVIQSNY
ncbi:MAG: ADP-ribosylation factor-like protein [Candidatus Helarchaeota archaeon]